eukprot:CAMPEP_0182438804 /NCGR_PEP_ID=MMETSP1167-20130531/86030_1 /TAXON_ID=2988 /ORGANISM="Mallomonas Sp, Strain CCMP3275" /LENGTH=177 /DNA_ID=CAMNT_0024632323 /DNA_START=537 /DNA_END=1067 /DNA_ORIENTATION=-
MTVCRSGAWSAKVVTSAWWVWGTQVTKTAPTGEYVSTGAFMIYGKKNYLAPTALEMGFGILFRLDDGSVTRHKGERVDKIQQNEDAYEGKEETEREGRFNEREREREKKEKNDYNRYGTDFSALNEEREREEEEETEREKEEEKKRESDEVGDRERDEEKDDKEREEEEEERERERE